MTIGMSILHLYGKQSPIKSYEPCQVGNEAAISSPFYVGIVFHRGVRKLTPFLVYNRGEKLNAIYSLIQKI